MDDDLTKIRERLNRTVSAETLIFSSKHSHVLLEGEASSGKTALLRMLFSEFYWCGKIPLYLSGTKIGDRSVERFRTLLRRIYEETYEGQDFTEYEQLDASNRVLLLDDFDFEGKSVTFLKEIMDYVRQFAGKAIVVGRDPLSLKKYAAKEPRQTVFREFDTFYIQDLGHVKRDEMIKRWVLLGRRPGDWGAPATLSKRDDLRSLINTTIGRNLVPSRPIFVLTILQSNDTAAPIAIGSTYGHYYQFLITRALLDCGVKSEDLDAMFNYLRELAFDQFFGPNVPEISGSQYRRWHERFCDDYGIKWDADNIRRQLDRGHILAVEATGNVVFKYQYTFYFFVAGRLARGVNEGDVRERVRQLCERLHVDEYANIVLFLVHHSNDQFVLQTVREAANTLLQDRGSFSLDDLADNEVVKTLNRLPSPLRTITLEERDHEEEQKRELADKDVMEAERREMERNVPEDASLRDKTMSGLDVLAQASVATKTVDLLGQILRNYYGSLRIETKLEIGKDTLELALRAMYSFVELIVTKDMEIVKAFVEMRREHEKKNLEAAARLNDQELERWARDFVFWLAGSLVGIFIRRAAGALGWEQLKPTMEKLVAENGTLTYRMVEMAALLNGPGAIPRKEIDALVRELVANPLGTRILRDLVSQRVYRYPTQYTG